MGQLECLEHVKGLGKFPHIKPLCISLDLDDFSCPVISIDALIQAKEAMGRPQDLENAKILRAIREHQEKQTC